MGLRRLAKRIYAQYLMKRDQHMMKRDSKLDGLRLAGERVVAGMATMPSREATFATSFRSIIRQVDRLYLYLDGHEAVPEIARDDPRVVPIFAHDFPGLHANGKLLGLVLEDKPCLYTCFDDDLYFYRNYVLKLRSALGQYNDKAIVGLHGTRLARPLEDYYVNRTSCGRYADNWNADTEVDILGTGAVLFHSSALDLDVRKWPKVSMTDLGLAIAAAKARLPMVSIHRDVKLAYSLARGQADSLYQARKKDSHMQTSLGGELIEIIDG